MSTAVPSFSGREVPDEVAVGVERWVGRDRYVPPVPPLVLVPEPYVSSDEPPYGSLDEPPYGSLLDEPPPYEPPPDVDVDDELSWSWRELLHPPPLL
ncbi:hypothetical protein [Streptomyces sp. SID14446]|uniref:hypothetical protein n=2 Tax=Streptomyces TaxID=1883 RepID=UPI001EF37ACE|nr:hypothetical protein [Streptomyces sp. SID14446]